MMEFSDQDLKLVLSRALRTVAIAILVGLPVIWLAWGWRSMLMFLTGGVIAATGIVEWRQLMAAVLARMDNAGGAPPRPMGLVPFWFFVRIIAAAGLLYVSLRSLDGRVSALLIGLGLPLIALLLEARRLLRVWSA